MDEQTITPSTVAGASGDVDWSPTVAYAVGLVATRGVLPARDARKVTFESPDRSLHAAFQRCLRISAPIRAHPRANGKGTFFVTTITDARLCEFLRRIGFRPGVGEIPGALAIPDEFLRDFVRGCIDGSGSVSSARQGQHLYMRVVLFSHNVKFISWLHATLSRLMRLKGNLDRNQQGTWWLEYTHQQALTVLGWVYYEPGLPCLHVNRASYEQFRTRAITP